MFYFLVRHSVTFTSTIYWKVPYPQDYCDYYLYYLVPWNMSTKYISNGESVTVCFKWWEDSLWSVSMATANLCNLIRNRTTPTLRLPPHSCRLSSNIRQTSPLLSSVLNSYSESLFTFWHCQKMNCQIDKHTSQLRPGPVLCHPVNPDWGWSWLRTKQRPGLRLKSKSGRRQRQWTQN